MISFQCQYDRNAPVVHIQLFHFFDIITMHVQCAMYLVRACKNIYDPYEIIISRNENIISQSRGSIFRAFSHFDVDFFLFTCRTLVLHLTEQDESAKM